MSEQIEDVNTCKTFSVVKSDHVWSQIFPFRTALFWLHSCTSRANQIYQGALFWSLGCESKAS